MNRNNMFTHFVVINTASVAKVCTGFKQVSVNACMWTSILGVGTNGVYLHSHMSLQRLLPWKWHHVLLLEPESQTDLLLRIIFSLSFWSFTSILIWNYWHLSLLLTRNLQEWSRQQWGLLVFAQCSLPLGNTMADSARMELHSEEPMRASYLQACLVIRRSHN